MIIKYYEIKNTKLALNNFFLLYGKNEGLKDETIDILVESKEKRITYEEKEILEKPNTLIESISSKSLFEDEKIIIIKRATDKIYKIIEEIYNKKKDDVKIILNSENLEKKSKLRSFFEKKNECICIAFYPDNNDTLTKLTYKFLKEKKILVSNESINQIVNKSNGDRKNLLNELNKVEQYCSSGKKLNFKDLSKLINLTENYSISELIDNCLAKNKKKTLYILNENNFNSEDCILITRTFLNKAKRILKLASNFNQNKNIEITISTAKPPIFWKDREIIKQQIYKWSPDNIRNLIYSINKIELLIKKNLNNSINIVSDFILEQSS